MAITCERTEGAVQLALGGPMTIYEAAEHKRELLAALAAGGGLELDLSGVDEIDTAGLQLLVLARREGARTGQPVRITGHGPALTEALGCYGLSHWIDES